MADTPPAAARGTGFDRRQEVLAELPSRRERNFLVFWMSQSFAALGDAFAKIIIPMLVLDITHSVAQMGLVTAIIGTASLIASVSSGIFIDRIDRRTLMMICNAGRLPMYLLIPVSWEIAGPSIWTVYMVTAVCAYLSIVFVISHAAAIPHLVPTGQFMAANSKIQATIALSFLLGPMLAGLAAARLGFKAAFIGLSLLYATSLALMWFVRMYAPSDGGRDEPSPRQAGLADLVVGIRFIVQHKILLWVAVLLGLSAFMSEATIDLMIFRLKSELHQGELTIGAIFGVSSIGAVIAAISAPRLFRRWGFGPCYLGSLIVQASSIFLVGLTDRVLPVAAVTLMFSLGLMMRNITAMSYRQEVTPSHLLGRVSAAFWSILLALGPFGVILAATSAQATSVIAVLIVMGLMGLLSAAAGCFGPVLQARRAQADAAR